MRLVSFSNASTQPFPVASGQIFSLWLARLKNALGSGLGPPAPAHLASPPTKGSVASPKQMPVAAANESVYREAACRRPARPGGLRIVREVDSAVGADCAGRMVISGRMADVCAELDRMALRGVDAS